MHGTTELIDESYLIWKLSGKLEADDLKARLDNIEEISANYNKELYVFADVSNLRNISMSSRKVGLEWLTNRPVKGLAVYGADTFLSFMVQKIIQVSSVKDSFKMVKDKQAAIEWMKNHQIKKK